MRQVVRVVRLVRGVGLGVFTRGSSVARRLGLGGIGRGASARGKTIGRPGHRMRARRAKRRFGSAVSRGRAGPPALVPRGLTSATFEHPTARRPEPDLPRARRDRRHGGRRARADPGAARGGAAGHPLHGLRQPRGGRRRRRPVGRAAADGHRPGERSQPRAVGARRAAAAAGARRARGRRPRAQPRLHGARSRALSVAS